ncbi:MAG: hypothetical protein NC400_09095 [Clostridium sp.]|nr:hypothetical protein [Clostridium sp.]
MMVHFTGKIYNFNEPPKPELTIVDIPFYEQENVSDEILINLDYEEMRYPEKEQNQHILSLPNEIKKIFKQNGGLVRGQEEILKELMQDDNYRLLFWTGKPSYEQLSFVLSLAWNNLLKEGETTRPMTLAKLVKLTFDYGNGTSIKDMIASDYNYRIAKKELTYEEKKNILDESIHSIFQIVRHWFQYKVPKWIGVINSLQEYACMKKGKRAGNYSYYASVIENDSLPENISLLLEYNIPSSTVKKIINLLPENLYDQELVDYIFNKEIYMNNGLIQYEKELLKKNLISSNRIK